VGGLGPWAPLKSGPVVDDPAELKSRSLRNVFLVMSSLSKFNGLLIVKSY